MPKPKNDKPAGGRRNVPLYVTLPPEERARIVALAAKLGRPLSWTVRDALRLYLDALETDAAALARLKVDARAAGKTKQPKRGRPAGYGAAAVKPLEGVDPAALQAALDAMPEPGPADLDAVLAGLQTPDLDADTLQAVLDGMEADAAAKTKKPAPKGKKG